MKTALVIMAAGIGSRFGGGIKQLASVDDAGHIIMDYSIHDAIEAGFNKIVFIIRKDIEADFREVIGNRIEAVCAARGVEVGYAFQAREEPSAFRSPVIVRSIWFVFVNLCAGSFLLFLQHLFEMLIPLSITAFAIDLLALDISFQVPSLPLKQSKAHFAPFLMPINTSQKALL